jgi:putative endonuclease
VICEVKTRSSRAFGAPVEAVGRDKQVRLRRLGAQFLETSGTRGVMLRYDVAAVECGVVTIVEGAF